MAPRRFRLVALACWALAAGAAAGAAPADEARRVLTLLRGIAEEYREALDERGAVVRPLEIEEGKLFLAEARDHAGRLGSQAPPDVIARLDALERAIDAHLPLAAVEEQVDALRTALVETTGVHEEFAPPASPSPGRGRVLFQANCVSCHGEHGAGDGPAAAGLERRPANFGDRDFMRGETPADFFNVITVGKRRSAMPAWDGVLSGQERWDLIAYAWSLSTTPAELVEGRGIWLVQCAGCHGAAGDGHGPWTDAVGAPVPDFTAPGALATRTDAELLAAVTDGVAATPMPSFRQSLGEAERWKVARFVRAVSLGGVATTSGTASSAARAREREATEAMIEVRRLVAAAADAHRRGDPKAVDLASDAYARFEPLEPRIAARDPALVQRVEEEFLRLRTALRHAGAPIEPLVEGVGRGLDDAAAALGSATDAWARFVQSATIILREGFEIVLILGALLAYVVKAGSPAMRRPIVAGALVGLAASVATAVLLMTVLRLTPGAGDVLEGIAMLLAAAVLFWVSYWIVSKAEAERWQRYIQGRVRQALAAGSGTALAATAFLAVYREGFETVLFYQALLGTAPSGDVMVPAGFAAGSTVLALVYLVLRRFGVHIPIRPFFLGTGALLIVMAIVFAGQGVHELQEAGVIGLTPVPWAPHVAFLGLFPALEPLLAQGFLLALVAYGVVVTLRARRRRDGAPPAVTPLEKRAAGGGRRA